MYKYLKSILNLLEEHDAEIVDINTSDWIGNGRRLCVEGTTQNSLEFEISLTLSSIKEDMQ